MADRMAKDPVPALRASCSPADYADEATLERHRSGSATSRSMMRSNLPERATIPTYAELGRDVYAKEVLV